MLETNSNSKWICIQWNEDVRGGISCYMNQEIRNEEKKQLESLLLNQPGINRLDLQHIVKNKKR